MRFFKRPFLAKEIFIKLNKHIESQEFLIQNSTIRIVDVILRNGLLASTINCPVKETNKIYFRKLSLINNYVFKNSLLTLKNINKQHKLEKGTFLNIPVSNSYFFQKPEISLSNHNKKHTFFVKS